jgi:hypothetical protein
MPFFVRKVRGQEKYRVNFKDNKGTSSLFQFDTREEAYQKMRDEIYKLVEKEKQQDLINNSSSENSDTEIEDV